MRQGVVGIALAGMAIAGCGGSGDSSSSATTPVQPDGASLTAPFDAFASQAYKDAGKDRQQDFIGGVSVDGCFVADDEVAHALGDVIGVDTTFVKDNNYLQGVPDQQERLLCSINPPAGTDHPIIASLNAGTTTLTPDQTFANLQRAEKGTHRLPGTAQGLDPASVLAVDSGGVSSFIWIDGDFTIGISGLSDKLSPDQGFAALSAAVQGVARTLSD